MSFRIVTDVDYFDVDAEAGESAYGFYYFFNRGTETKTLRAGFWRRLFTGEREIAVVRPTKDIVQYVRLTDIRRIFRVSDRSGEAIETAKTGSTVGESAAPTGNAQKGSA